MEPRSEIFAEAIDAATDRERIWMPSLAEWIASDGPATRRTLIVGNRSFYDRDAHVRLADAGDSPYLDSELARPYLQGIWLRQRPDYGMGSERIPFTTEGMQTLHRSPQPLYCRPTGGKRMLVYLDVTSAFWTIYHALSLDLGYEPWASPPRLSVGRIRFLEAEELMEHRGARLSLLGITRSTQTHILRWGRPWRDREGRLKRMALRNAFLAPDLWALIAHTLHAMAVEVVREWGAWRVHTDGWLVDAAYESEIKQWAEERWSVVVSVKHRGYGHVAGLADWSVGDRHQGRMTPDYFGEERNGAQGNLLDLPPDLVAQLIRWRMEWAQRAGLRW